MTDFSYHAPPSLESPHFSYGSAAAQRPSSSSGQLNSAGTSSPYNPSSFSPLPDPNHQMTRPSSAFEHLANAAARQDDGDSTGSDREPPYGRAPGQQQQQQLPSPLQQPQLPSHLAARRSPLDHEREVSAMSQPPYTAAGAPPPFGHAFHFQGQPTPQIPGANIRNTRPMTAPSSVSAPYFHGSAYVPHPGAHSAFYPSASLAYPATHPFHFHVDNGMSPSGPHSIQSGHGGHHGGPPSAGPGHDSRSFGLPDPTGAGADHQRFAQDEQDSPNGGSIFQFGPPPRTADGSYYSSSQHEQDAFSHSRPTTADSRPGSSHAPTLGRGPGSFPYTPNKQTANSRHHGVGESKVYNFVSAAGQSTKRPRRRYDEIERLYNCDYPGCQKSYGTLNHLNSHKTMQKHGPKSTPAQFKEMRKAWRENKKMQAALAARNGAPAQSTANKSTSSAAQSKAVYASPVTERIRPVTSAGEYHYNAPAPFMSPAGASVYGHATPTLQLPPPPPSMYEAPAPPVLANPWGSSATTAFPLPPTHSGVGGPEIVYGGNGSSSHRPVTAPTYYNQTTPAFGYHPAPRLGFNSGAGGPLGGARRLSLPGEIQQPTPVFGFNVPGGEAGFTSIQEEEAPESATNRTEALSSEA